MSTRFYLNLFAVVLTLAVIMLGAYTRLSDAGLGCPDWPGCYGHLDVPTSQAAKNTADAAFGQAVETGKAWREMIHRYFAGTLGLVILLLALLAIRRTGNPHQQRVLPWVAVGVVAFQALLGMWTVTLLLKPLIVTAHLLGGMTILALLGWCLFRQGPLMWRWPVSGLTSLRLLAGIGLVVLVCQIFLGAWTSTNYAALACPDFPTCQAQWWPQTDFETAFTLWHGLGINYEYGILSSVPRQTIHWVHRLGACVVALTMLILAIRLFMASRTDGRWAGLGGALLAAVALQITLGISTVVFHLPLYVAVGHNGGAAVLLLTLVAINHAAWSARHG
ncbi:COX15/CtaA family protein [Salinisphaera japonica]|uniref:Cytochrome oxidase assembly protein n=1 Tax=Salinisphaera japonica YTM-1 TaxID=1209778 RepID=A0A423PME4_9GAMM|nr:COX15/CtaA family protein [Salinisphaera japonica]ROO26795.1 cytochrome oxidase assembly protein [Salinisphaera japonica YTM-1]